MVPNHIDDFIPLLAMKEPILNKVAAMATAERALIPEKSRIYYLSKKLQVIFSLKSYRSSIGLLRERDNESLVKYPSTGKLCMSRQ